MQMPNLATKSKDFFFLTKWDQFDRINEKYMKKYALSKKLAPKNVIIGARTKPKKLWKREQLNNICENLQFLENLETKIKNHLHHYKKHKILPQIKKIAQKTEVLGP